LIAGIDTSMCTHQGTPYEAWIQWHAGMLKDRISAPKGVSRADIYGTAETVPFVQSIGVAGTKVASSCFLLDSLGVIDLDS